jgi:parallel beta-helix repeat protein
MEIEMNFKEIMIGFMIGSLFLFGFLFFPTTSFAEVYYVQAQNKSGKLEGTGRPSDPWSPLKKVFQKKLLKGGDVLILKDGYYGNVSINKLAFSTPLVIRAEKEYGAKFRTLSIKKVSGLNLRNLSVSLSHDKSYNGFPKHAPSLVYIDASSDVRVKGFNIYSVPDVTGWTKEDWVKKAANGVFARGENISIVGNKIRNVKSGINAFATKSHVAANSISHFSGDGIRALGDYSRVTDNTISYCYQVDKNHADGIQSWSIGPDRRSGTGTVYGVVIENNRILNLPHPENKLRCNLQGIGMFDGMFEGWVIRNNLIVVDHWHGISLYGSKNSKIVNNTLVKATGNKYGPPQIRIVDHKKKKKSSNNIIANNILPKTKNIKIYKKQSPSAVFVKNFFYSFKKKTFVSPEKIDFRLKPGLSAIGKADIEMAPDLDILGKKRKSDNIINPGAFE